MFGLSKIDINWENLLRGCCQSMWYESDTDLYYSMHQEMKNCELFYCIIINKWKKNL